MSAIISGYSQVLGEDGSCAEAVSEVPWDRQPIWPLPVPTRVRAGFNSIGDDEEDVWLLSGSPKAKRKKREEAEEERLHFDPFPFFRASS